MFGIGEKLDMIRIEVSRLVEAVQYLIKVQQQTNRILDPDDSKNPLKKREFKSVGVGVAKVGSNDKSHGLAWTDYHRKQG